MTLKAKLIKILESIDPANDGRPVDFILTALEYDDPSVNPESAGRVLRGDRKTFSRIGRGIYKRKAKG